MWADASKHHDLRHIASVNVKHAIEVLTGSRRLPARPRTVSRAWAQWHQKRGGRFANRAVRSAYGLLHCDGSDCDRRPFMQNKFQGSINRLTLRTFCELQGDGNSTSSTQIPTSRKDGLGRRRPCRNLEFEDAVLQKPHVLNSNVLLEHTDENRRLVQRWIELAISKPDGFCSSHTNDQAIFSLLVRNFSLPLINPCIYLTMGGYRACQQHTKNTRTFLELLTVGAYEVLLPSEYDTLPWTSID